MDTALPQGCGRTQVARCAPVESRAVVWGRAWDSVVLSESPGPHFQLVTLVIVFQAVGGSAVLPCQLGRY